MHGQPSTPNQNARVQRLPEAAERGAGGDENSHFGTENHRGTHAFGTENHFKTQTVNTCFKAMSVQEIVSTQEIYIYK